MPALIGLIGGLIGGTGLAACVLTYLKGPDQPVLDVLDWVVVYLGRNLGLNAFIVGSCTTGPSAGLLFCVGALSIHRRRTPTQLVLGTLTLLMGILIWTATLLLVVWMAVRLFA